MATNEVNGFYRFQQPVRARYLNVVKASQPKLPNGKVGDPTYNGTFLLTPDSVDLAAIRSLAGTVAKAKWPTRALNDGTIQFPLIAGEKWAERQKAKGRDGSIALGHVVLNASSKLDYPPQLGVLENGKLISLTTETLKAQYASRFYAGSYVAPTINLVAWAGNGSNIPDSVKAYLQMVVFIKDGQRLAGASLEEVYKDYVGQFTPGVDPTGGTANMDDEVPF